MNWIEKIAPVLMALSLFAGTAFGSEGDAALQARKIIELSGVRGGIVVHLGCGEGELTAALRVSERYTVQGLDPDAARVARARRRIQSLGLYGPISVEQFSAKVLPYTDNLINLVVVQDTGLASPEEVLRVLAPGGVACVHRDGEYKKIVKSRPDNIDEWSHFLHGANNNAVAGDSVVGPPRSLQWIAPPLWLRSHETPSGIQSPVSAGGRLFYFFDEGLVGITDERIPDRWSLLCRDAFNGKLLWKRKLGPWGWRQWSYNRYAGKDWTALRAARTDVPAENQRRIVAAGDRLYATLSYGAPLSILDAATGETLATVGETDGASEILVSGGIALVHKRPPPDGSARRRGKKDSAGSSLVAADGRTGKLLWQKEVGRIRPLALAIDRGRVVYLAGKKLAALDLREGRQLWASQPKLIAPRTLLTVDDVIVLQAGKQVAAHDARDGSLLWHKTVPPIAGGEGADLFVIDGLVWRGMLSVDDSEKPVGKSPNAMVLGWDLRTGEERKRIVVKNFRSPEHHHRCYRNKATDRYLISSYEGAEFLDFQGDGHSQNNWLRGACRNGMMPCNGLLYVPADQCFCQPGAKLLGYTAVKAGSEKALPVVPDEGRLLKGEAHGSVPDAVNGKSSGNSGGDWPTFRHDPARRGSTGTSVSSTLVRDWEVQLGGSLTTLTAAGDRVYLARSDAHGVHALDLESGKELWHFTAGGRVDSPPTIHRGMVLFGSRDGYVYCLRASDGRLVWRFLAAPADRRIACCDQLESAWPVHGSVLLVNNVAYCTAGRSTYLDGGIRLWGLDPATGSILHRGLLEGPHPSIDGRRDVAFYLLGANSDVLVSEGGFLYMRQKKMTPGLKEIKVDVLSSKGAQDVGLHIFSTSGLLDGSWYNRTFWMYSRRWPGFQLANQAPKTGQLLVIDGERTYAVRAFYRRNVHSPMFYPGKEGYLVFADKNTNEPQIVGEEGSRKPIRWLPQSDYSRARGKTIRKLESEAFGLDKMIGYTRAEPPLWTGWLPVRVRAMVKAGNTLFVAGPPDLFDPKDPYAPFEGKRGARLVALSARDGKKLSEMELEHPPVFDGMIAAGGRLFLSLRNGSVICLRGKGEE